MKNIFCNLSDISNEASVESFFIDRMIDYLHYEDKDIKLKASISEYTIGQGRKKVLYKPDYVLLANGIPAIVIDAKSTSEEIEKWEEQCSSYSLEINKEYDYNPLMFYILSNGNKTNVYQWDKRKPLLSLSFMDFVIGNPKLESFYELLCKNNILRSSEQLKQTLESKVFDFEKISLQKMGTLFQKIHKDIWTIEKKSVGAAFFELIKVIFVKIKKDKDLYGIINSGKPITYKDVVFSVNWIQSQTEVESPVNDILFSKLLKELEVDIRSGKKKRFFEENEKIELSPETIKKIVKYVEHIDFYGMEEDVHGRMFESFLDATVRGKELGQYFTPRDIVEFMVGLSNIHIETEANRESTIPKILDACCGSGGFLIKALTELFSQVDKMSGLSNKERDRLRDKIKYNSVYGIDAGSNPAMYKIARMNMYLHGDGGSNIYYADSLNKDIGKIGSGDIEVDAQIEELRKLLKDGLKFDIILSNPPFSLLYQRANKDQETILNQYELSIDRETGTYNDKIMSSVMFIERYKDLIENTGTILAIIDDSILSGSKYINIRKFIRNSFIIKGIISLPGDAFQRSSARVKTSILILKKKSEGEQQNDIFLASSVYIGLESKIAKRIGIKVPNLNNKIKDEISKITNAYNDYLKGKKNEFVYPFSNCNERLDVKYCVNDRGRRKDYWKSINAETDFIENILHVQTDRDIKVEEDGFYQLLSVNYEGNVFEGEFKDGRDISYPTLYMVSQWDILISNMGFGRGAIGIVPPYLDGCYVSNEYTILRADDHVKSVFYWNLLRTKEILGDILASTTGMNRGRIKWDIIKKVEVPVYTKSPKNEKLTKEIERFWAQYGKFRKTKESLSDDISKLYKLNEYDSFARWLAYKSPE
jgi:type I restriction enzyme M protein